MGVGRELDSSHTSGLTSCLYNRRAGKLRGPLSDTGASLVPGFQICDLRLTHG